MNPDDFKSGAAGECVRIDGGHWAFVPGALPTAVDLNELWQPLGEADAALGAIQGLSAGAQLPFLHMLIASAVRREAALSSQIEGIQTQLPDLLRAEVEDPGLEKADDDLKETRNYVTALNQGVEALKAEQPIKAHLVRGLHATLMKGARGQDKTPGAFRTKQNYIGPPGAGLANARYVPPPPHEVPRLIEEWEVFAGQRGGMPDLVRCAILHHRFEAIHPFFDGNGRVGRLMIPLFLIERQRLFEPLLYLSDYLEQHRPDYYALLQSVHMQGEWTPWLRFFLTGVTYASRKAVGQATQLSNLRRELRGRLVKKFRARNLIDELFANPYVDSAYASKRLSVDRKTAQKSIDLLEEMGIVKEITGRNWGRLWVAPAILQIIHTPDEEGDT